MFDVSSKSSGELNENFSKGKIAQNRKTFDKGKKKKVAPSN